MPNHVTSAITVTGPESDIDLFVNAHFKEAKGDSKNWFDFDTIIPKPESIKKTVSKSPLTQEEEAEQEAAFAETGFRDWYEWSYHHWAQSGIHTKVRSRSDQTVG